MAFLDDLDRKITMWGQGAIQKTKEAADSAKLQSAITSLEAKKKEALADLGRYYYGLYRQYGGNPGSDGQKLFDRVDDIERQIGQYSSQLQRVKGIMLCPNCHAEVPANSLFCNACGTKMPQQPAQYQSIERNIPPQYSEKGDKVLPQPMQYTNTEEDARPHPVQGREAVKSAPLAVRRFCENCGAQLDEDQLFCINCGARVEKQPADDEYVEESVPGQEEISKEEIISPGAAGQQEVQDQDRENQDKEDQDRQAEGEKPRICPNCGKEAGEGMRFCMVCGTKID